APSPTSAIHVFLAEGPQEKTWMPATSAGMTQRGDSILSEHALAPAIPTAAPLLLDRRKNPAGAWHRERRAWQAGRRLGIVSGTGRARGMPACQCPLCGPDTAPHFVPIRPEARSTPDNHRYCAGIVP